MDARHGRNTLTAPHPAHIAHDTAFSTTLIPALRLSYHIPPPEYAGLTSPALESGEWHMRLPAVEWAKDGPACASRARLEVHAPLARRAPGFSYVVNGNVTPVRPALMAYKSELFSAYNVTLDADRSAFSSRYYALSLASTDLEYEGTRVKSPVLGRDLNPMGRGDGTYYTNGGNIAGGSVAVGRAKPAFLGFVRTGYGTNMNNALDGGGYSPSTWPKGCCCGLIGCIKCPTYKPSNKKYIKSPESLDDIDECCNQLYKYQTRDDCPPDSGWGYYGRDWDTYCPDTWEQPSQEQEGSYSGWGTFPDLEGIKCTKHRCNASQDGGIIDAMWVARECIKKVGTKILGGAISRCVIEVFSRWIEAPNWKCENSNDKPRAACVGWISGLNDRHCKQGDVAISCQYAPGQRRGRRDGYILFCKQFFDDTYVEEYASRFCFKTATVLHEALHFCGVMHGTSSPTRNEKLADAILCRCKCDCFAPDIRREKCRVLGKQDFG